MSYTPENIITACHELRFRHLHALSSPLNADRRQRALAALMGKKVPKSKSGFCAMRDALLDASGLVMLEQCVAVQDVVLSAWIDQVGSFRELPSQIKTAFGTATLTDGKWTIER